MQSNDSFEAVGPGQLSNATCKDKNVLSYTATYEAYFFRNPKKSPTTVCVWGYTSRPAGLMDQERIK